MRVSSTVLHSIRVSRRLVKPLTASSRLASSRVSGLPPNVPDQGQNDPPRIRGAARTRPEFDFDYLLAEENVERMRAEISARKGVGDIDAVHACWSTIQSIMEGGKKVDEREYERLWDTLYDLAARIPNRTHDAVPRGGEEQAKVVDILNPDGRRDEPKLRTAEQIVQSWRSLLHPTEAAGQRSYAYLGPLARLEHALLDYAWTRVTALGFKPVHVSDLVPRDIGHACGIMGDDLQYKLDSDSSTALSGTAEMGVAAMLRGVTLPAEQLPMRFVARSRCFRPEISKSASEAKLYRVHEFSKVEMFTVCTPSQSEAELSFLVDVQKDTMRALGLHARVLEMPSEELGASAHRKYDIEAWMPGRKLFGEVSSASNCTDFQSRRLGIRYTDGATGKRCFAHTCNGTAIAVPRALIAVLETFQDETRKGNMRVLPESIRHRIERRDAKGKPIRDEKIKFQTGPSFF